MKHYFNRNTAPAIILCLIIFIATCFLFNFNFVNRAKLSQSGFTWLRNKDFQNLTQNIKLTNSLKDNIETFKQIALKHGTDKVGSHHYEYVYGQLLGPIRFDQVNLLEIGLGCGMPYGPGKSIPVWKEFLPNARVSILEYDEKCARSFEDKVDHLYVGDQRDVLFMKSIGVQGGLYDIVVDDGGHSRTMQINSLVALWPYIKKNGGIYIIEDIFTSYVEIYNDNKSQSALDLIMEMIVVLNDPSILNKDWKTDLPQMKINQNTKDLSSSVMSINCFERACALIKK